MKQGLSLRVSQHLALTPQLQQSIRLLQLSTLELSQEVGQMLDDNPFLELDHDEAAEREAFGLSQADVPAQTDDGGADGEMDFAPDLMTGYAGEASVVSQNEAETPLSSGEETPNWEGDGSVESSPNDSEWGDDAPARSQATRDDDDAADATELARNQESLTAFLHRQALGLRLGEVDRAALRFLIESLNDDGYLDDSLESLAQGLAGEDLVQAEELVHHFTVAQGLLQNLEPTGVGARNLAECLMLQLRARRAASTGDVHQQSVIVLALQICAQPMELLARRDIRRLMQLCGGSDALMREALALIARLEPRPGRSFVDVARNIVVPDVIVTQVGRGARVSFRVQLNPEVMPRLRVHDLYANALKGGRGTGKDSAQFAGLQQRLQEARWFIKNIQQRFDTILRVSKAIVERQKNFFTHGEMAMRPLVLREIADELGLHESTISRVTTAKYMATPFGTFELKYFFGSGLGTETGGQASSTAVRALIKQFVAAENPRKPLSDQKIADLLQEQGIECARRTVAKYREALKIAPTNLRKTL
jgi:RNA polymerase sigma-54 factor